MKNRQLAQLCAQGVLEWKHEPSNTGCIYHEYLYVEGEEDQDVGKHFTKDDSGKTIEQTVMVRKFAETEWHEPSFYD